MSLRTITAMLLLAFALTCEAKGYRISTSSQQEQSEAQKTILFPSGAAIVARGEAGDIFIQAEPRLDFFQNPWIAFYYKVGMINPESGKYVLVNAKDIRLLANGKELKRFTQPEQLAWLDKKRRSADFWGSVSAGLASMNASKTAGRYSYTGKSSGIISDAYGNRAKLESEYKGTIVDRAEAQQAGTDAAINSARATDVKLSALDSLTRECLEGSPEQLVSGDNGETQYSYLVFELPKDKRGDMVPLVLQASIGGTQFHLNFELLQ